ncbi:hypothetical protein ACFOSX_10820 [Winogradskyella maritima]|uniref:Uncharacterized protein n=1 Tax=Winogradskyella maritima TaxID=1517766 RepID=A0ABV8AI40_9FLAO
MNFYQAFLWAIYLILVNIATSRDPDFQMNPDVNVETVTQSDIDCIRRELQEGNL